MATFAPAKTTSHVAPARDSNDFLYSWKEMASFLKCGVRTVQRWEKSEGLPVHRHKHWKRGTVYALKSEVQEWLTSRREETDFGLGNDSPVPNGVHSPLSNSLLYSLCEQARERAGRVRAKYEKGELRPLRTH